MNSCATPSMLCKSRVSQVTRRTSTFLAKFVATQPGSRKIDHKLAETTWVHQIFGGRLRSRVTCRVCGYNSDTFDRILDLSLDIFKSDSVKDALKKFVAIDYLKGADKYRCEK